MKKILLMFLTIFLLNFPAQAINGHLTLNYDTINGQGTGEIYLYEEFLNKQLIVGGNLKTDLIKFSFKDGYFPAGVPKSQTYDLIIEYEVTNNITVGIIEGCKHYFSQSKHSSLDDESYIKITTKYKF